MKKQRQSWWLKNTRKGVSYYVRYVYVLGASLAFLSIPWAYNSCQQAEFSDPMGGELYKKFEQESVTPALTHYADFTEFNIHTHDNKFDVVFVVDVSCSMKAQDEAQVANKFKQAIESDNFENFVQALAQSGFDARLYLSTTIGHAQTEALVLFENEQPYIQVAQGDLQAAQQQLQLQQALSRLHANTCQSGLGGQVNDCECGVKSAAHLSSNLRRGAKWVGVIVTDENDRCQQQAHQSDNNSCIGDKVCTLGGEDVAAFKNRWQWYSVVEVDEGCTVRRQFPDYETISQPEGMWDLSAADWGSSLFQSLSAASWRSQAINLAQGCTLYDNNFELSKKVESVDDQVYDADYCKELPCWVSMDTADLSFNKEGNFLFRWQKALQPGVYKIYYHCRQ